MRIVYTDGSCSGNPGPGGWAWATVDGPFAAGPAAHTTNQRMEIQAALEALRANDGPVEIRSDSTYVVNCFRDRWWVSWLAKGWVNSQRKPVVNRDLWEPLIDIYRARDPKPLFTWVKGHSSDPMNDLVDRLAVEAAVTQQSRSGDSLPSAVAAVAPAAGSARDRRLPAGWLILVTGQLRVDAPRLVDILRAKHEMHPDLVVVTTLQAGAQAAVTVGLPFIAVQPFPDSGYDWLGELRGRAASVIELERTRPDTKPKVAGALKRRDAWLRGNVDEALVVWDGNDRNVGLAVRSLQAALGEENVWVVEP